MIWNYNDILLVLIVFLHDMNNDHLCHEYVYDETELIIVDIDVEWQI